MKKIILAALLLVAFGAAQCLSAPISTRAGVKFGINPGTHDLDDGLDAFTGTGVHFGIGMGTDIFNLIGIDMGAQFRTTSYMRETVLGDLTFSYNNLYFPFFVSLKAGMLPLVSPYIGAGVGINIQFDGVRRDNISGLVVETPIEGTATSPYLILGLGAEIKLIKLRITPEFTANIDASANDANTAAEEKRIDYHISVGLFYAP